jgi:ankyrin repeat protein
MAAAYGFEDIVKMLIDAGANVDLIGNVVGSALQAAAYAGHEAIVALLIRSGANVDVTGGQYGSAIQTASYQGRKDVVALLIRSGANVNVRGVVHREVHYRGWRAANDVQGNDLVVLRYQSALSIAREKGFAGIMVAKLLEDAGAIDFNDLVEAD